MFGVGMLSGGAGGIAGDNSSAESSAGSGSWVSGAKITKDTGKALIVAGSIAGALVSLITITKILKGSK